MPDAEKKDPLDAEKDVEPKRAGINVVLSAEEDDKLKALASRFYWSKPVTARVLLAMILSENSDTVMDAVLSHLNPKGS